MDYIEVLKKSWSFIKKYKYLWLLGILSGGAGSGNFNSAYQYGGGNSTNEIQNIGNGDNIAALGSYVHGARAEVSSVSKVLGESIGPGALGNPWLWLAIAIVILIVVLGLIYLSITAKSAIVWSVAKLDKDNVATLKDSWRAGHKIFWRRLSLAILMFAVVFIPLTVLAIPIVTLAIFEIIIPAVILGLIFGLVFIIYLIYLSLIFPYSERLLVVGKMPAVKSLYGAKSLFGKSWREIVLMYLIIFGIRLVAMMAIAIAVVTSIIILIIPTLIVYQINHITSYVLGGIFVLIIVLAMMIISGVLNAYSSSCVTLTYNRIK
jgi:hypothetical protein